MSQQSVHRGPRGTTLVELVVAFTMMTLVAGLGAVMLASAERQMRGSLAGSADRRVVREVAEILESELASVPRDDVTLRGDTAVDLMSDVAVAVVCVASGRVVVLPPELRNGATPFTRLRGAMQVGDLVTWFDTANGGRWPRATLDSVVSRTDGAGCLPSSGFRSAVDSAVHRAVWRLVLSAGAETPEVGTPLRVRRPARYTLYYGSDKHWTLGLRACDLAGACGAVQPVAGPLATPADSGLRFERADSGATLGLYVRTPLPADGRPRAWRRRRFGLRNGPP